MFTLRSTATELFSGIYLSPLGKIPAIDRIDLIEYRGELRLPLGFGSGPDMHPVVQKGDAVEAGTLLASGVGGYRLYSPCRGVVGELCEVWLSNKPDQAAIAFEPSETLSPAEFMSGSVDNKNHQTMILGNGTYSAGAIWQAIEHSGLMFGEARQPLGDYLQRLSGQKIRIIAANAAPLESCLNGSQAMLHCFGEQIFAGLSIIKRWLDAEKAILSYTHGTKIDRRKAEHWQVECAMVNDKYPHARGSLILSSLEKHGYIKAGQAHEAVLFDCQLLWQVERVILGGQLPTARIVTISGDGVRQPGHYLAMIGTPLMALLERAGLRSSVRCVVEGSSLSGASIDPELAVVTGLSDSYIAINRMSESPPQPCIRCGWCIHDCPAGIDPAKLYQLTCRGQYHLGPAHQMQKCIECGICSYVCPSHLRILEHIRLMKQQWRQRERRP